MRHNRKKHRVKHSNIFESIRLLKKFFLEQTDTFYPADKLLKAVLYHQPPLELIKVIFRLDPYASHPSNSRSNSVGKNKGSRTALQIAVQNNASVEVVEELIRANPLNLFVSNGICDPLTYVQTRRNVDAKLMESLEHAFQLWDIFEMDDDCSQCDRPRHLRKNESTMETHHFSSGVEEKVHDSKCFTSNLLPIDEPRAQNHDYSASRFDGEHGLEGMSGGNVIGKKIDSSSSPRTTQENNFSQAQIGINCEVKEEKECADFNNMKDLQSLKQIVTKRVMEHINQSISLELKQSQKVGENRNNQIQTETKFEVCNDSGSNISKLLEL